MSLSHWFLKISSAPNTGGYLLAFIPLDAASRIERNRKSGPISSISKSAGSPYWVTASDRADGLKCRAAMLNGPRGSGRAIVIATFGSSDLLAP